MRAKKYSNMNSKNFQKIKNRKATETGKQEDRRIVSWPRRLGGALASVLEYPCGQCLGMPLRAVNVGPRKKKDVRSATS